MGGQAADLDVLAHEVCSSLWVLHNDRGDHLDYLVYALGEVGVPVQNNSAWWKGPLCLVDSPGKNQIADEMFDRAIEGEASSDQLMNQVAFVQDDSSLAWISIVRSCSLTFLTILCRWSLRLFVGVLEIVLPFDEQQLLWNLL